jgi:hypothetical protein
MTLRSMTSEVPARRSSETSGVLPLHRGGFAVVCGTSWIRIGYAAAEADSQTENRDFGTQGSPLQLDIFLRLPINRPKTSSLRFQVSPLDILLDNDAAANTPVAVENLVWIIGAWLGQDMRCPSLLPPR